MTFFCAGIAVPQGSKVHLGRGRLIESANRKTKLRRAGALDRWREAVGWAARAAMVGRPPLDVAASLKLSFFVERPKSVTAPFPASKPDVDKLARAALDAMTGIVYTDDSRVTELVALKRYAGQDGPGLLVQCEPTGASEVPA